MKRQLRIEIQNLLPEGITFELYQHPDEVRTMLVDEGFGQMAQKFMQSVMKDVEQDRMAHWHRWEGYFHDKEEAGQDLLALGAAFFNNSIYIRALLCRGVPQEKVDQTEHGLGHMIDQYLDGLRHEHLKNQSEN